MGLQVRIVANRIEKKMEKPECTIARISRDDSPCSGLDSLYNCGIGYFK